MTKTLDLINAIEAGQSIKIHSLFEELVNARLVDAIEQRRAEIADLVFNGAVDEEVQLDEEFVNEMSQYDMVDLVEFMMSEEFGSIDELSKTTLGNYVKKAAVNSVYQKEKQGAHDTNLRQQLRTADFHGVEDSANRIKKISTVIKKRSVGIDKAVDRLVK